MSLELEEIFFFSGAILLLVSSLILNVKGKSKYSVIVLFLAALFVFMGAASLDSFLGVWDERFHALVAKNLMDHPLMPTLYEDPAAAVQYKGWVTETVWLHKQPLFLWQIALSFKLFGINEFTLRLPSVIMMSLLVLIFYRCGKLLINEKVGYLAGFFFVTSYWTFEVVAGWKGMDHNDTSFLFYVSTSIWAWIEYLNAKTHGRPTWYWILLIGMFSGAAILCKWLVGLFIYLIWGTYILLKGKNIRLKDFSPLLLSLVVTIAVFLPWNILASKWYPEEYWYEFKYNSLHFTKAIEGHDGDVWYYFSNLEFLYGVLGPYLLVIGMYFFLKDKKHKREKFALFIGVLFLYLFFTLAQTKMRGYTWVASGIMNLCFASLFYYLVDEYLLKKIKSARGIIWTLLLIIIGFYNIQIHELKRTRNLEHCDKMIHNKAVFLSLKEKYPDNSVVFGIGGVHFVECMFYSGFPAYNFMPSKVVYADLIDRGRTIIIFKNDRKIPEYIEGVEILEDKLFVSE